MVVLSPVIKLNDKATFGVLNTIPLEFIVVRLQDLILKRSFGFNKTYYDVMSAGGLHKFLNFRGPIILSLIMRDEILANFDAKKYATAINSLWPNSYTTIDCETYAGEHSHSLGEVKGVHEKNKNLIKLCPRFIPIGLVKGCTIDQIELHIELLKSLGIKDFIFHVGDFFRSGHEEMINQARCFSNRIRNHARYLILYGMGAQSKLLEFSFADAYVTFSHFVTALNGMKFVGTKKVKYVGGYNSTIAINNFVEMYKNVKSLDKQTKLFMGSENKWVGELEAVAQATQNHHQDQA